MDNISGPVTIVRLGKDESTQAGQVLEAEGGNVTLQLESAVEPGTLLKLETDEALLLAEVCSSHGHQARVIVHEWVGKSQLLKLRNALEEYSLAPVPVAEPVYSR